MKTLQTILLMAALCTVITAPGQIKKGSVYLGGDIGGSTSKTKTNGTASGDANSLRISPVYGKAVKDNRFVGFDATMDFYKNESSGTTVLKQKAYGGGVFIRQYKPVGKSDFFLFLQGRTGYLYRETENFSSPSFNVKSDIHSISFSAYPGISYAVSKRLHIETGFRNLISVNFEHEKRVETGFLVNTIKSNSFFVYSSLENISNLYAGFRLLLGK